MSSRFSGSSLGSDRGREGGLVRVNEIARLDIPGVFCLEKAGPR